MVGTKDAMILRYMSNVIINSGTVEQQMLVDFERELGENKRILETPSNEMQKARARARITVIGESVEMLKKMMKAPPETHWQTGGYNPDELNDFQRLAYATGRYQNNQ